MAEVTWKICKQNILADYKRLKLIGGGEYLLNYSENITEYT